MGFLSVISGACGCAFRAFGCLIRLACPCCRRKIVGSGPMGALTKAEQKQQQRLDERNAKLCEYLGYFFMVAVVAVILVVLALFMRDDKQAEKEEALAKMSNREKAEEYSKVLVRASIGTATVILGPQIQPIVLIINGFIAANVQADWERLLASVTPQNLLNFIVKSIAAVSIGTVAIQNVEFEAALQGGVIGYASYSTFPRTMLISALGGGEERRLEEDEETEPQGEGEESSVAEPRILIGEDMRGWILGICDALASLVGSLLSFMFKALFQLLNSAWVSASMMVDGWYRAAELAPGGKAISGTGQFCAKGIFTLIALFWHSYLVAKKRTSDWDRATGKKQLDFKVRTKFMRYVHAFVTPIEVIMRCVMAFSSSLGNSLNLKGEPRTTTQIVRLSCEEFNVTSLTTYMTREAVKKVTVGFVQEKLVDAAETKEELKHARLTAQLAGLICGSLGVEEMRKVTYKLQKGSGDFSDVLDELFDEVKLAIQKNKGMTLGKMSEEDLEDMWVGGKEIIKSSLEEKLRYIVLQGAIKFCKMKDPAQKQYVFGLLSQLNLEEMTTTLQLIKTGRFSIEDLVLLAQAKAEEAAAAKFLALEKAKTGESSAEEAEEDEGEGDGAEGEGAEEGKKGTKLKKRRRFKRKKKAKIQAAENLDLSMDSPIAKAVQEIMAKQGPMQLSKALCDVISFSESIQQIPVLGFLYKEVKLAVEVSYRGFLSCFPYIGPKMIAYTDRIFALLKQRMVSSSITKLCKKKGIPLEMIQDAVKKFASVDEYLDDTMEQIVKFAKEVPPPKERNPDDCCDCDCSWITNCLSKCFSRLVPGGVPKLILQQTSRRGPTACKEMLFEALVELFEIDLASAKRFVNSLSPKELMQIGQDMLTRGFPFDKCTELVKNKEELITFLVPIKYLDDGDGLGDEEISLSFEGKSVPVAAVNEDWMQQVKNEVVQVCDELPQKGDRLAYVGHHNAREFTKAVFESTLEATCEKARKSCKKGEEPPPLKFVFSRGVDIDFAERFRQVLPSVLRKIVGIPFDQGQRFARNLQMTQMQKIVLLLFNGGPFAVKQFDDIAKSCGADANFPHALRANVPTYLYRHFGFSMRGAEVFAQGLDEDDHLNLFSFSTRLMQTLGFGELETMFRVMRKHEIHTLEKLHKSNYPPRVDLNRLLWGPEHVNEHGERDENAGEEKGKCSCLKSACGPCCAGLKFICGRCPCAKKVIEKGDDPVVSGKRTNLVMTDDGKYELWQSGEKLGNIHQRTFNVVLAIWRENLDEHLRSMDGIHIAKEGVEPWSSEEAVDALRAARTDPLQVKYDCIYFKWPEYVIDKAMGKEPPPPPDWQPEPVSMLDSALSAVDGAVAAVGVENGENGALAEMTKWEPTSECLKPVKHQFKFTEADKEVAFKLFALALAEAREDVWTKYERKLMYEANVCLGPPTSNKVQGKEVEASKVAVDRTDELKINQEIKDWLDKLLDKIPDQKKRPKKRTEALKTIEICVRSRDTFRLTKLAQKYGLMEPLPMAGLLAQLKAALPFDVTDQANELAEFVSESNNPLTGHLGSKKAKNKTPKSTHNLGDLEMGMPSAKIPKFKDLFVLAQKNDFEKLTQFQASQSAGGSAEVADTMRARLQKRIEEGFLVKENVAEKAVQLFIPALYSVVADATMHEEVPSEEQPIPADADRNGSEVKGGRRVSVVNILRGHVCIARPKRGWLLESEVEKLPESICDAAEEKALDNVSKALREVRQYNIEELQDLSDDLDMGIDFGKMGRERILKAICEFSADYEPKIVQRALKHKNNEDLKVCLAALDSMDMNLVIERAGLPAPSSEKRGDGGDEAHQVANDDMEQMTKELDRQKTIVTENLSLLATKDREISRQQQTIVEYVETVSAQDAELRAKELEIETLQSMLQSARYKLEQAQSKKGAIASLFGCGPPPATETYVPISATSYTSPPGSNTTSPRRPMKDDYVGVSL
eukprot:gnl/MRDRNA2_/MRDRNA2_85150_c0_seq1.p1 gnl/MRDRNA2_/MRDRNA2_85150_c0~~gnl/MRDRNA2_/MRDRNA2_85150_c0_seq1.p1  ORF type:complete len:1957 (-),score=411.71 gnl/MRDRNA2_/MRDRNA2_85150_c0_seq1:251-6121(-)